MPRFLPSDLIHIILGKLSIYEQYKRFAFSKAEFTWFMRYKNFRKCIICACGYLTIGTKKFYEYRILLGMFSNSAVTYCDPYCKFGRYLRTKVLTTDLINEIQEIKTHHPTLMYKKIIEFGDLEAFKVFLYELDLPRIMAEHLVDHFDPNYLLWPTDHPRLLLPYPDLVRRYYESPRWRTVLRYLCFEDYTDIVSEHLKTDTWLYLFKTGVIYSNSSSKLLSRIHKAERYRQVKIAAAELDFLEFQNVFPFHKCYRLLYKCCLDPMAEKFGEQIHISKKKAETLIISTLECIMHNIGTAFAFELDETIRITINDTDVKYQLV